MRKEVEDVDVDIDGFEDIEAVDLTREDRGDKPAEFLVHWTIYLDKLAKFNKIKVINPTTFDYETFMTEEQAKLEEQTRRKGYRVKRQHVRASMEYSRMRKQDVIHLDLNDDEGWASFETVLLAWHRDKKKDVQINVDLRFARKTASRPVQELLTDDDDELESSDEEVASSQKKKVSQLLPVGLYTDFT